jgi:hypothetical protein
LKSNFDRSLWTKPISNLINIVKNGISKSRNIAVLRLAKVYEINGLFNWIISGKLGKIPSPPNDLLDELINRVITRRQPGLKSVIEYISAIVRKCLNFLMRNEPSL